MKRKRNNFNKNWFKHTHIRKDINDKQTRF